LLASALRITPRLALRIEADSHHLQLLVQQPTHHHRLGGEIGSLGFPPELRDTVAPGHFFSRHLDDGADPFLEDVALLTNPIDVDLRRGFRGECTVHRVGMTAEIPCHDLLAAYQIALILRGGEWLERG